jgi:hypothetical protein
VTNPPDSAASPTSNRWLHLTLFAMETIGTVILYWKGLPLYRQLSINPTAYGTHEEIRFWALSAIALIQVGYWVRYRVGPVMPNLVSTILGHIVLFLSRMVFTLATTVFSFVFISQKLASEITTSEYVFILTGLFSLFLYSLELQEWGNKLMRREKKTGEPRAEARRVGENKWGGKHDDT